MGCRKEEGFHFSNYKGYDKEKVKKELALQLQEKEAQREKERQVKALFSDLDC